MKIMSGKVLLSIAVVLMTFASLLSSHTRIQQSFVVFHNDHHHHHHDHNNNSSNRTKLTSLTVDGSIRDNIMKEKNDDGCCDMYVRSFRRNFNNDRIQSSKQQFPLSFLHIAKTGGTAIEAAAAAGGGSSFSSSSSKQIIRWGCCMFNSAGHPWCPDRRKPQYSSKRWGTSKALWHLPRDRFPIYNNPAVDPYANTVSFAVVRDIYDKVVSEFYWRCRIKGKPKRLANSNKTVAIRIPCEKKKEFFDRKYFNTFIQQQLETLVKAPLSETAIVPGLFQHYTPQYEYVVLVLPTSSSSSSTTTTSDEIATDANTTNNSISEINNNNNNGCESIQIRMVDHVLRFENLSYEFNRLMDAYNLSTLHGIYLPDIISNNNSSVINAAAAGTTTTNNNNNNNNRNKNSINNIPSIFLPKQQQHQQQRKAVAAANNTPTTYLTTDDLDLTTIQLLNDVYHNDFDAFGYEMK